MASEDNAGNIWNAGTLEWLPNGNYSNRSVPIVTSREPLWDQPGLAENVDAGRYYLPNAPTGGRETIVTSPVTADSGSPHARAAASRTLSSTAQRTLLPKQSRPFPPLAGSTVDSRGITPRRASAMLEYNTSEFSRFRLQDCGIVDAPSASWTFHPLSG